MFCYDFSFSSYAVKLPFVSSLILINSGPGSPQPGENNVDIRVGVSQVGTRMQQKVLHSGHGLPVSQGSRIKKVNWAGNTSHVANRACNRAGCCIVFQPLHLWLGQVQCKAHMWDTDFRFGTYGRVRVQYRYGSAVHELWARSYARTHAIVLSLTILSRLTPLTTCVHVIHACLAALKK